MSNFDDLDALEKIAVNLFYGWGYNFYRLENQLRADDLTVRAKVGWLLGQARAAVETAAMAANASNTNMAILPRERSWSHAAAVNNNAAAATISRYSLTW